MVFKTILFDFVFYNSLIYKHYYILDTGSVSFIRWRGWEKIPILLSPLVGLFLEYESLLQTWLHGGSAGGYTNMFTW
jgi:hypothetical protein